MNRWVILTLKAVIAVALAGSVVVQVMMVAMLWLDSERTPTGTLDVALTVIGVVGTATMQVVAVCIWRLLTMVGRGTVFSHAAFRYVDLVIGAIAIAAVLTFGIAVVARFANRAAPGDEVAPGLVALVCGFALVLAGVALVVYVMRTLLAQAVALDTRAKYLEAELDEVI
ncbi:DUF2975 domain-containing protein [Rhodococcus rhodnii]|uniref:Transmembrane transport protein n=2 Tax=Rhodococcus rhodnii TaxID=38312 RepID=R7WK82_9NOCA|nr:DUF2975 domain-containing protein [Rhodococcus rhodnii]EOM75707.1 hypothetical protein Rrhod_2979 [Rhodococcus rhodnii LMG 5362]TXG89652.1 DUF2975 domain-containing protein [Rhodococcus rhodnii]